VRWTWTDRPPEPARMTAPNWLAAWARDRDVFRLDVERLAA
jgi:hypothetical protein